MATSKIIPFLCLFLPGIASCDDESEMPPVSVAIGNKAEEQGDKLVNFLSKVTKVHAYINKNSVQEWFIDVSDSNTRFKSFLFTLLDSN